MPLTNISSRKNKLCLMLLSVLLPGGLCFAQPAVTLSVKNGPPTTNLFVSGTGFPASTAVEIYFDVTELAQVVTNSAGSFSKFKIQVPASALPGANWITAEVSSTGEAAQARFMVNTKWDQFHFSVSHSGVNPYENVLSPTTVGNLGLRWSYATRGEVGSSPAVADGVVYVGSGDNNVYALNASTGAYLWQYTTGAGVYSSPTVAYGAVYVGSYDGNVYALNASTGALLWQYTTGDQVDSSPAVANRVVYIGSFDGNVYGLNASTGVELWRFTTGGGVASSPAVANGVVFVGSGDDNVYALNASTGAKLWQFTTGYVVESSPATLVQ